MYRERIGKYRIVGELGRGTMGEVYKAHDPVLNRFVALKTLAVRSGAGDEVLQRFQREAQAAALLNHPNIVTVHDFGNEQGLLYMAMELLEGTDLRDAIDGDLLATLDEKLDILDGVLAALDYAHGKGVVHRDIKPANIHLGPGRQVKIMDFGLARVSTSEMTQDGIVLGTPNYMSPEQALGDKVDGRSDLFSAGAVLYELLTGHKPFEADSTPSVLFQVVHKQPPPVRRWAPDAPAVLVTIVNRALDKDRDRRYPTAADMRNALVAARRTLARPVAPAVATPPPPLKPPPLPPTRPRSDPSLTAPPLPAGRADTPPERKTKARAPALRSGSARWLLAGAVPALLVLVLLTVTSLRGGRPAPEPGPVPSPSASSAQLSALTQELVTTQTRLARRELDDKNYAAAVQQAESALRLDAGHAEAQRILAAAKGRLRDLDAAIAEAHQRLDAGDTAAASQSLARLLELDPRHPAAAELSTRLNEVFRARSGGAAASAREARAAAAGAGVETAALAPGDESAQEAEALAARGEFADATRTFLEARDAFDRARRAARQTAAPASGSEAPGVTSPPTTSPAAAPAPDTEGTPGPARRFAADGTTVATPSSGGVPGFDGADVGRRRPPQFEGRLEFEVLPPVVHPGEAFVVRIHVVNQGRKPVRIRALALQTVADGRRTPAPAKALQREIAPQGRAIVAEYSGVWNEAGSWALEAAVTADRNEVISSRLRSN